jgi:aspartate kinase
MNNNIRIFKFGGASVKNADAVRNVLSIVKEFRKDVHLILVVSAMAKTTNALEVLVNKTIANEDYSMEFETLRNFHYQIINELFSPSISIRKALDEIFNHIQDLLITCSRKDYNFLYDQVVSQGEILSTKIVTEYFNASDVPATFIDARTWIRTDTTYREGKVDWSYTTSSIAEAVKEFKKNDNESVIITQGFIGQAANGSSTTLGREGSDYTAAILAYALDASDVTIWKDVPGVLNADPKFFPDAQLLPHLSYQDAIEMAYYGATVIHPKTMKPLQNKNIALHVKSFLDPHHSGTVINDRDPLVVLPCFIFKTNQALLSFSPKDFSFIVEENISQMFSALAKFRVKVNLMQHSALSFQLCVDDDAQKLVPLLEVLKDNFNIEHQHGLELCSIRNYNQATVERLMKGRYLWVEQKNSHTIRLVISTL